MEKSNSSERDARELAFDDLRQETLDMLNKIGFDRPVEFLEDNDVFRVNKAVKIVLWAPERFKNPAGFVRMLVKSPEEIRDVRVFDKFEKQKYEDSIFLS